MLMFPIKINGESIRDLDLLKQKLDLNVLLTYRNRFAKWLQGADYPEEATKVQQLPTTLSDDDWLKEILQIIGLPAEEYQRVWDSYVAEKSEKARQEAEQKKQIELACQHRDELLSSGIIPVEELDDCLLKELIEQNKDFSILHLLDDDAVRTVIRICKELKKQNKKLFRCNNMEHLENKLGYSDALMLIPDSLYPHGLYFELSLNENRTITVIAKDFRGAITVNNIKELEQEVYGGREKIIIEGDLKKSLFENIKNQSDLRTQLKYELASRLLVIALNYTKINIENNQLSLIHKCNW